jgi:hypothetical protein
MLGSALGAADGAIVTHESHFKIALLQNIESSRIDSSAASIYDFVARNPKFKALWRISPTARISESSGRTIETARQVLFDIVEQYAAVVGRAPWSVWVDHSPNNVRHICDLLALCPDAKFIHLVRDGRAIAASVLPLDWGPNDILSAGKWWVEQVGHGCAAELRFPDRVVRVRYEDLVSDPETTLGRICEFVGLPFSQKMVGGNALAIPAYTKKQHLLVGTAPDPRRISAWRAKLSNREVELFEHHAGDMLKILGYDRISCPWEHPLTNLDKVLLGLRSAIRTLANRRRMRARTTKAIETHG